MITVRNVRIPLFGAALLALAAVAPVGATVAGTHASAATGCKAAPGTQSGVTPSYRFALRVTMPEQMYTPAQVRKMHPKHGEVMLRGIMAMGGMSMGGMRHVEVQICSAKTRAVVTNASPTIVLVDNSSNTTMKVPVAVMEGIGEGVADLHYGNNVTMSPGHRYTITVTLNGERAVFHTRLPKSM